MSNSSESLLRKTLGPGVIKYAGGPRVEYLGESLQIYPPHDLCARFIIGSHKSNPVSFRSPKDLRDFARLLELAADNLEAAHKQKEPTP